MNLIISFLAGVLTVLAPCVLPMLPIILSSSVDSELISRRRALIEIIFGMTVSIFLFSSILKSLTLGLNVSDKFWVNFSATIILIFGLNLLFGQKLNSVFRKLGSDKLAKKLQILSRTEKNSNKKQTYSRLILGASMGPVFSSCSPAYAIIVATILPVRPVVALLYLLAYCLGLGVVLYLVGIGGQRVVRRIDFLLDERGIFKRLIAILLILTSLSMYLGWDRKLTQSIIDSAYIKRITNLENLFFVKE